MWMAVTLLVALTVIATERVQAQTFTTIHTFDGTDGQYPTAALIQATDGDLYGTIQLGDANGYGGVFKITTRGSLTTVYGFCEQPDCLDGGEPIGPVIQATDGDFYGVTGDGGANCDNSQQCGTVFSLSPHGELTTLYSFCSGVTSTYGCLEGQFFGVGLVQAANGDFYGTTTKGGANSYGSVYKITHAGVLTTEVSFNGTTDGEGPLAGLVQATNGLLYGTTSYGGTVFDITEHGRLTTLTDFTNESGSAPQGALIQATDGNLYGSTGGGGSNEQGTIFKITPAGVLTTLYNFCSQPNCADGADPWSALTQGSDGNFYGVTYCGGVAISSPQYGGCGTIFRLTPNGDLTTLYSFCPQPTANGFCPDGNHPYGLIQATDGNFYGTTWFGGSTSNYGTVYRLSVGLGPFVALQTAFGGVGATVKILGTSLTGTTSVTFNGTPATFTIISKTHINATVPTGATTGTVTVTTPDGMLSSNRPFTVNP
jgi:uncharacterized repeat protein (TIGR03803 family)